MNRFRQGLARLWLSLQRPILRRRVGRLVLERIDGVGLVVLPEVFNPVIFRSSALLAHTVATSPLAAPTDGRSAAPGEGEARALDMGTGTGVLAIFAARRGFHTVGVDINPEAVRCARINALVNHVEDRVEFRQGNLFDSVKGEHFQLVLFNPPFFRGAPRHALDAAWRGTDVMERFAAGLPGALAPEGRALIVLSTDGDAEAMLRALREQGLAVGVATRRDYGNEIMTIYAVSRREE